ncbi:hypothetical protein GCM10007877_26530 [Marinibactrum halimedae]|uniref:Uncharacterized protein n=1 Tax=Marinibactrum halimedae TaxID=1444977 RepID=A0AA37T6W5_9GAMM|nr:hypothetical protein GCM10007877_26530 [Marinibactrum halimedae]
MGGHFRDAHFLNCEINHAKLGTKDGFVVDFVRKQAIGFALYRGMEDIRATATFITYDSNDSYDRFKKSRRKLRCKVYWFGV